MDILLFVIQYTDGSVWRLSWVFTWIKRRFLTKSLDMEPRRNLEARGTSDGTHRKSYLHTFPCECMYFDDTCAYPMSDCRTHTSSACMSACILDCVCAYSIVVTSMYSTTGALSSTEVGVGRYRAAYKVGHHTGLASFMTQSSTAASFEHLWKWQFRECSGWLWMMLFECKPRPSAEGRSVSAGVNRANATASDGMASIDLPPLSLPLPEPLPLTDAPCLPCDIPSPRHTSIQIFSVVSVDFPPGPPSRYWSEPWPTLRDPSPNR